MSENGSAYADGFVDLTPLDGQVEWISQYHTNEEDMWTTYPFKDVKAKPDGFTIGRAPGGDSVMQALANKGGHYGFAAFRINLCRGDLRPEAYNTPERWAEPLRREAAELPIGVDPKDPDVRFAYENFFEGYWAGTHFVLSETRGFMVQVMIGDYPLSRPGSEDDTPEKAKSEILDAAVNYLYAALNFYDGDPEAVPYWDLATRSQTAGRKFTVELLGGDSLIMLDLGHCLRGMTAGVGCKQYLDAVLETLDGALQVLDEEVIPVSETLQYMFAPGELPDLEERMAFMDIMVTQMAREYVYSYCYKTWELDPFSCTHFNDTDYIVNNMVQFSFPVDGVYEPLAHFGSRMSTTNYATVPCSTLERDSATYLFAGYNNATLEEQVDRCSVNEFGTDVFLTKMTSYGHEYGHAAVRMSTLSDWNEDTYLNGYDMKMVVIAENGVNHLMAVSTESPGFTDVILVNHPSLENRVALFHPLTLEYVYVNPVNRMLMLGRDIEERPWDYAVEYELAPVTVPPAGNPGNGWNGQGPDCPLVQECLPHQRLSSITTNPYRSYNPWDRSIPCTSGAYYYCDFVADRELLTETPFAKPLG